MTNVSLVELLAVLQVASNKVLHGVPKEKIQGFEEGLREVVRGHKDYHASAIDTDAEGGVVEVAGVGEVVELSPSLRAAIDDFSQEYIGTYGYFHHRLVKSVRGNEEGGSNERRG